MTTPEPRPHGTPGTDPTLSAASGHPATPPGGGISPSTAPTPSNASAPGNASGPGTAPQTPQRSGSTGKTLGRTLAAALLVFVTVVLVLFVMFNTQTVDISLVFTDVKAPLVVALLIAAVLGGLVVGLLDALMTVRGRRRNR